MCVCLGLFFLVEDGPARELQQASKKLRSGFIAARTQGRVVWEHASSNAETASGLCRQAEDMAAWPCPWHFDSLPVDEQVSRLHKAVQCDVAMPAVPVIDVVPVDILPARAEQAGSVHKRARPGRPPSNPAVHVSQKRARFRQALMLLTGGSTDSVDGAQAIIGCLNVTERNSLRACLPDIGEATESIGATMVAAVGKQQGYLLLDCFVTSCVAVGFKNRRKMTQECGVEISQRVWEKALRTQAAGGAVEVVNRGGRPGKINDPQTIARVRTILVEHSRETCLTRTQWRSLTKGRRYLCGHLLCLKQDFIARVKSCGVSFQELLF